MARLSNPVLVIADERMRPLREIADYEMDLAFGSDENDFEMTCRDGWEPPDHGWLWIDGTEFGGTVDSRSASTSRGSDRVVTVSGRTWHGVLAGMVVVPDAGQSHLSVSGPSQQVLRSLISRFGLGDVFSAPDSEGSGSVTYTFDRFTDLYTGIRKMLASSGLRLSVRRSGTTTVLGAVPVSDGAKRLDSDMADFTITRTYRRVNHLVCAGTGEDENRAVVHFYADAAGKVSKTQTLFGADEIAALYDYSNADEAKLEEDGRKKLEDMQSQGAVDMTSHDDIDVAVGDIIASRDNADGTVVSADVVKKVLKVSRGIASYSYEVGSAATTEPGGISGSAESNGGGGGHEYYAGKGLKLDGFTFSAEVGADDLDAVMKTADAASKQASDASSSAATALDNASKAASAASDAMDAAETAQNAADALKGKATQASDGLMSAADKAKLDGIADRANRYVLPVATPYALGGVKPDGSTVTVSEDGTLTAKAGEAMPSHPVGTIVRNTTGINPSRYGLAGTWEETASIDGFSWIRTR